MFESAELRAIEKSRFFQVKDCCLEMLEQWLQGGTSNCDHGKPVTWKTLLQAMMDAQCSSPIAVKVWRALSDEGSNLLETLFFFFFFWQQLVW